MGKKHRKSFEEIKKMVADADQMKRTANYQQVKNENGQGKKEGHHHSECRGECRGECEYKK